MKYFNFALVALAHLSARITAAPVDPREASALQKRYVNDFDCRSTTHPNPVVLIHALFVNEDLDLNFLGGYLNSQGFCTFSQTYGAYPAFPLVGGIRAIEESSQEIADFILEVQQKTGARKVDLVGHSEGGFQALYVPKFREGIAPIVDKIVTMGSPTKGADLSNLFDLAYVGGQLSRDAVEDILDTVGCPGCDDVAKGGDAPIKLNNGPIRQADNMILNLASRNDRIATPPSDSFIPETGVVNKYVQDRCPLDFVGHVGLAVDTNVWHEVQHWLDPSFQLPAICLPGVPF